MINQNYDYHRSAINAINSKYGNNQNWAVVHNLSFVLEDTIIDIDHIIVDRYLNFNILNSQLFLHNIKITPELDFMVLSLDHYSPVPSPLTYNDMTVLALEKLLKTSSIIPDIDNKNPNFSSYVLMGLGSTVVSPKDKKVDSVVKVDQLYQSMVGKINESGVFKSIDGMSTMVTTDELKKIETNLTKYSSIPR